MAAFYGNRIRSGLMTLEEVPSCGVRKQSYGYRKSGGISSE